MRINTGDINVGNKVGVNRDQNVNSIRNKWNNVDNRPFDRDYWNGRRSYHNTPDWRWHNNWNNYPRGWGWGTASWATCGTWFAGWNLARPFNYDYGNTVVYRDNYVYINDQQYATPEDYYQQAGTIAASIPAEVEPEQVEWMPLGVFALAEDGANDSGMMLQLAVSKEGILAGTFYNDITGSDRPVEGMVDQTSQRAAWRFSDGKNKEVVMETGIYNLTEDEATALVHFGPDDSQTWLMVRLEEPEESN